MIINNIIKKLTGGKDAMLLCDFALKLNIV